MTCRVTQNTKGLEDLLARIVEVGTNVDAAAARAVVAGGDVLLEGMLEHVPVGEAGKGDPHPGQLKHSLRRTETNQNGNYTYIYVGLAPEATADVARYGNAQEYGYGRGGKQYAPQSYIRAGTDEKKNAARRALLDSLKKDGMASG